MGESNVGKNIFLACGKFRNFRPRLCRVRSYAIGRRTYHHDILVSEDEKLRYPHPLQKPQICNLDIRFLYAGGGIISLSRCFFSSGGLISHGGSVGFPSTTISSGHDRRGYTLALFQRSAFSSLREDWSPNHMVFRP